MNYAFESTSPINGLKILNLNTKANFKLATITVKFALPLDGDTAALALLPGLLKRTSKSYPTINAMNKKLANLYGAMVNASIAKQGETQVLALNVTMLEDRFSLDGEKISAEAADLLIDLIFNPNFTDGNFDENDIEREKRLSIERIESELNDKRYYALKRCTELMCENELYAKSASGEIEDIKAVDAARLKKAWNDMLGKSTVYIGATGSMDTQAISKKFAERFAAIERSELAPLHTEFVTSADEVRKIREEMPVKQGKLVLGFRAGMTDEDDNYYAIKVMTDLFGGGVYSKLFNNVREKMSLCYYCSASFNRSKGLIMVQSGIENENEEKAINAILKEFDDMKNGNFTDEELDASIKGLTTLILSVADTPESLSRWYSGQMLGREIITPEEYAKQIASITREQVIAAASAVTLDTVYMLAGNGSEE